MIKLEIKLKDIDYSKLADQMLPVVLQNLSVKDEKSNKFIKFLIGMKGLPNKVVKAALGVMPQQTKDDIAVYFMTEYKEEIIKYINHLAVENQIAVEVEDIQPSVQEGNKKYEDASDKEF